MSTLLTTLKAQGATITSMTADSRKVQTGSLFLAYPGERVDGREFITQAVNQGAAAVMWEADGYQWDEANVVPNVAVSGLRRLAGNVADSFYDMPSQDLWMIGVTGTNGKTSCSHWLAQAMTALGRKTAVIGTLGNGFAGALSDAINTTPDPILLHGMLADYLKQGASTVAMEVSSHGLDQGRVNGVRFDVAVFTNLTRDHLDYHGDMQSYAAAKQKLFAWEGLSCAVLNVDDEVGKQYAAALIQEDKRVLTYGLAKADVSASDLTLTESGLSMKVKSPFGETVLHAPVLGRFNAYNVLAVYASLLASDVSVAEATQAIAAIKPVSGRMEQYGGGARPLVVVDYAHTPDALEKVLATLREQTKGQLICVFGCGGDRDKGKRSLMAKVVSKLADVALITSDNPRFESPESIVKEVAAGMEKAHEVILDRAQAISKAIASAKVGDVVLVAGKGHEDYQDIAGVKHPFSDVQKVKAALEAYL